MKDKEIRELLQRQGNVNGSNAVSNFGRVYVGSADKAKQSRDAAIRARRAELGLGKKAHRAI